MLTAEPDSPMTPYTTVFLDLDDTLYPSNNGVWDAIGRRISLFMEQRLGIEADKIRQIRDSFLRDYGTTLHGLMANFNADPHEYLDFVHDIPLEEMLLPNPDLRSMLAQLPQRRIVFTNASLGHVERVIRRRQLHDEIIRAVRKQQNRIAVVVGVFFELPAFNARTQR